ncbi:bacteriophage abortive infection AbiH family protein [Thomasclavelia cocleata]|jgi:hypothetical protein|uniref:bacteriophage abortive infection AbiH family protein n=1 Tax=Thomasclavelia cocleata TaxID=69824 RepID=UPI00272DECA4|nr:bacteriophage abortive infection AbiH family protein [Thomasclavelia cocleata]
MNILVIGNGFDLAHGLPTSYKDFLEFTDNYMSYAKSINDNLLSELKTLVSNNCWLEYFKRTYIGNGWIDFEKEMSNVIMMIDQKKDKFVRIGEPGFAFVKLSDKERKILMYFDSRSANGIIDNKDFLFMIKERMLNDLNRLIRCLEIYLDCYINHSSVKELSPDIADLNIDKVLSFNYTNTYARIYDNSKNNNIEYDYIHGKADIEPEHDMKTNDMVLGIDEYLPDDRKNKDLDFIAFKKFYQRIYKQTGCKYKEWVGEIIKGADYDKLDALKYRLEYEENIKKGLDGYAHTAKQKLMELKEQRVKHNLYIFGHSLDVTDKDILKELILNDNVHTTIFYHNKEVKAQQIANLVKVIGQDELIRRSGEKTIEFTPQQKMNNI